MTRANIFGIPLFWWCGDCITPPPTAYRARATRSVALLQVARNVFSSFLFCSFHVCLLRRSFSPHHVPSRLVSTSRLCVCIGARPPLVPSASVSARFLSRGLFCLLPPRLCLNFVPALGSTLHSSRLRFSKFHASFLKVNSNILSQCKPSTLVSLLGSVQTLVPLIMEL